MALAGKIMSIVIAGCCSIPLFADTVLLEEAAFEAGTKEKVFLSELGRLELVPGATEGTYISPELELPAFTALVASWNAQTERHSSVELEARIKVDGKWSRFFTYGIWSSDASVRQGNSGQQEDEIASIDIDTILPAGEVPGSGAQLRLTLRRTDTKQPSASISLLAVTVCPVNSSADNASIFPEKVLEVPRRMQSVVPKIGDVICSPTSVAMVLEYYGAKLPTENVAEMMLMPDAEEPIYGNWSYNAAGASEYGFKSYVGCFSMSDLAEAIAADKPVVVSFGNRKPLPEAVEEKREIPLPHHLSVLTGFSKGKDGNWYVHINDPAMGDLEKVPRKFLLKDFLQAWSRYVYIVEPQI